MNVKGRGPQLIRGRGVWWWNTTEDIEETLPVVMYISKEKDQGVCCIQEFLCDLGKDKLSLILCLSVLYTI